MGTIKPAIDHSLATTYLESILATAISNLQPINVGELSKVYRFTANGEQYVVHFNQIGDRFNRDAYLYSRLSKHEIPVPRIVKVGNIAGYYYSTSTLIPGKVMSSLSIIEVKALLHELVREYQKVTKIAVEPEKKFGWIQLNGDGSYHTWTEYIASFFVHKQPGFWENWQELFENSFLEKDVFDYYMDMLMELTSYAPKEKYFVHGDFHLGNLLSNGHTITGIIDWEMALYGDFMFDVANLHIWTPELEFPDLVKAAWKQAGMEIPNFEERLRCGMLFRMVDGLRFYAKKDDKPAYEFMKEKLRMLEK